MPERLEWGNDVLTLTIEWDSETAPALRAVRTAGTYLQLPGGLPAVEVLTVGAGHDPASNRLTHSVFGRDARTVSVEQATVGSESTLEVLVAHPPTGAHALWRLRVRDGIAAVTSSVEVRHPASADASIALRSVSSWSAYLGVKTLGRLEEWSLISGRSDWMAESRWSRNQLSSFDFPDIDEPAFQHSRRGRLAVLSSGTWSTGSDLPVGVLAHQEARVAWGWQIEHNGPWRWELGEDPSDLYLALCGPTNEDHQWLHVLAPGETFRTPPVTVALGQDFTTVIAHLTRHRRADRRPHPDNVAMPVVFNDYMNTINGDPTTEKLLPLVDAAADVGAEVFCIDAGWYDDGGDWWDSVGEWLPSTTRFPDGLSEVVDRIGSRGMVPGLWLEPEVVGVRSPLAETLPIEAFITRAGLRVVEHGRYHLDFRSEAARHHLDEVVDRLVRDFHVGYFKFDYNIDPRTGSDRDSTSPADALLAHNRAYLAWVAGLHDRHPRLVLENCASGGMRADPASLAAFQLQSTSDQQNFRKYPAIAAAAPASMPPEQAANWAYPQPEMSPAEAAFCLVTGLVGRFYLSGHLGRMSAEQLDLVRSATGLAKHLRGELPRAFPSWPLGLPQWDAPRQALALQTSTATYLAVWSIAGADSVTIPLDERHDQVDLLFPAVTDDWQPSLDASGTALLLTPPAGGVSARFYRLARTP